MNERVTIGGNNPPSEIEILQERLDSHIDTEKNINELVSREIPKLIEDDAGAGKVTDYIKALKGARTSVEKIFKTEKAPILAAGKVADKWKTSRWEKIDARVADASKPVIAWNAKKEEAERKRQVELARLAQEEADKLAREAAEHADAGIDDTADDLLDAAIEQEDKSTALTEKATGVIKTRSTGMYSTASSRKVWVGKIDNYPALDVAALAIYFTADALDKAIRAAIKDGIREIKGVKIYQEDKLTIR